MGQNELLFKTCWGDTLEIWATCWEPIKNLMTTYWEVDGNIMKRKKIQHPPLSPKGKIWVYWVNVAILHWWRLISIPNSIHKLFWPELTDTPFPVCHLVLHVPCQTPLVSILLALNYLRTPWHSWFVLKFRPFKMDFDFLLIFTRPCYQG